MSVAEVQARIGQIESYLATLDARVATLSGRATGVSATSGASVTDFATQLAAAKCGGSTDGQLVDDTDKKHLGVPSVWGGTAPGKGLDCSGLVQRVDG